MQIINTLTDEQNERRMKANTAFLEYVGSLPDSEAICDGCEHYKKTIQPSFCQMNAGSIERSPFAVCSLFNTYWEIRNRPAQRLEACLLANAKEIYE